ncbi:MAG: hypothetical protein ABUL46_04670, partial [Chitinophaga rupis]
YVAYGRRPFGPYVFRGFGDVADPVNHNDSVGEGSFYCAVPKDRTNAATLVWNSSDGPLTIKIQVNDNEVTRQLAAGEKVTVDCPVKSTRIKMTFTGDRRLVLLQTAFTTIPSK